MTDSHIATVTQTSPLQVTVDGATAPTNARHLAAYSPALADRVAVIRLAFELLVLGKVT